MGNPKFLLLDQRRPLAEKLIDTCVTFAFLVLCIWISQGSKWWTFFSAVLFIVYALEKARQLAKVRQHEFSSIEELYDWAEQQRCRSSESEQ